LDLPLPGLWLIVATLLCIAIPALADDRPEEIVVTAERRETPLQEAPLSLAIVSGEGLDESGIETTLDLPLRIPGMVFTTNSVLGQPYIRGVGSDIISVGGEASVATFVDGVYRARPLAALQDFYDIERVEVLKGPQGTLFGRNATGGAIHVLSKDPEPELVAGGDLLYGSFDALRIRGFANVPLLDDRLLARLSGIWHQREGYLHNQFLGTHRDGEGFGALRGKLAATPLDGVQLLFSGDYSREQSSRNLAPKLGQPLTGSLAFPAGGSVPAAPRQVLYDVDPHADVEDFGGSARLEVDRETFRVTSLTACRETRLREALDLDATQRDYVSNFPKEDSQTVSEELQVASLNSGRFDWIGGVFYLHEDASQSLDVRIPPLGIRDQPGARIDVDAVGVFGQLGWNASEQWRASAGLRYSYERKREKFSETLNAAPFADFDRAKDWDAPTPRFVIEYTPRPDLFFYASAARGFKSGGFNSGVAQEEPFAPESLWAVELGSRASPWERTRLHASLFYYAYDDIQLQVISDALIPFPRVENAGSATIWGAEAELAAEPLDGLGIQASGAFLDAHFDHLSTFDPNDLAAGPDQSGNRMPRAPQFAAWVAVQYALRLGRFGTLTPRAEYRYQSQIFFNIFEDRQVRQSAFSLWNLWLGFQDRSGRYSAAVFARNLGDELYRQSDIRVDGSVGNLLFWGAPRTYGFQVAVRFGGPAGP
jgi:iron complex outermembrane receptor protein